MPTAVDLAEQFRKAVERQDAAALGRLAKTYSQLYGRMTDKLDGLLLAVSQLEAPTKGQISRLAQYKNLINSLEDELSKFGNYLEMEIKTNSQAAVELAVKQTAEYLRAAGYAMPKTLPVNTIYNMLGFLSDDSPLWKRINQLAPYHAEQVANALLEGTALGYNPVKTAKIFENVMGGGLTDAMRMSRTTQLYASREANRASYAANSDIIDGWMWITALDGDVCMACAVEHGKVHPLNEGMGSHYNCFPAGVLVTGPTPVAGTKRFYTGDLISIRTASGIELSFTPNHPILTRHGWVAGGLLQKGDYVIRSTGRKNADSAADINYNNVPTLIEDIVKSFDMVLVEVPTAPKDFHGDGIGSKVHTVFTNSLLGSEINPAFNEPLIKQNLSLRSLVNFALASKRRLDKRFIGARSTANGFMGSGGIALSLFRRHLARLQEIGFRIAAYMSTLLKQAFADNASGNSIGFSQSVLGFAGNVSCADISERSRIISTGFSPNLFRYNRVSFDAGAQLDSAFNKNRLDSRYGNMKFTPKILQTFPVEIELDEIAEIDRSVFSGHVYNLQTTHEWYVANSIITHNCRCSSIPTVKGYEYNWQTGEDWFKGLDEGQQEKMMGKSAFEAWKDGKFDLADLETRRHDDVYGEMLARTPLEQLINN